MRSCFSWMTATMSDDSTHDDAASAWHIDLPSGNRTLFPAPVSVRWSDDGSRIIVMRTIDPRFSPLLDAAKPDIGAVGAVAAIVCLLVGFARILRRPRISGRRYCRRCNHDVNTAGGDQPSALLCPECGAALAGRGTVAGRTRLRRLATVGIPSVSAAALGAALFVSSVEISRTPVGLPIAWPLADASRLSGWPFWRHEITRDYHLWPRQLDVIRVDPDGLSLEGSATKHGGENWIARPEGQVVTWPEVMSERTGWINRINWYDSVADRAGSVDVGDASAGFISLSGWSPDGGEIVAVLTRLDPAKITLRDDGSAIAEADVVVVSPATETVRVVDRSRGFARQEPGTAANPSWTIGPTIAAVGSDPRFRTVTLSGEQCSPRTGGSGAGLALRELTVIGNDGLRTIALSGTSRLDAWGFRRASIASDGRLRVEFSIYGPDVFSGFPPDPTWMIDLETGAVDTSPLNDSYQALESMPIDATTLTLGATSLSPDGTKTLRVEVGDPPITAGRLSGIRIIVEPKR